MASSASKDSKHIGISSSKNTQSLAEMEDEEEELFEINLEAVNSIPPPHYWEAFFTATSNALLANCLLPISDLSSAIPTVSTACSTFSRKGMTNVFTIADSFPEKFLGSHFEVQQGNERA